ncbi:hypothetical protein [Nitrosomonas ureae]|uniref:Uncharacterized protein n=1 Tax=Nitrosomonas ureae TaxID=44577 RepID=A0A1H9HIZ4_9PROT|nr:hypothetical protein [Nitrosomonas ureae]SEQ62284.1 hypothetical protein SAMN05421510_11131 [Nitrosomonas ureae]
MSFQEDLASLNEYLFYREFTFSSNNFQIQPNQEVELADSILFIGKTLLVFQLKEREEKAIHDAISEEKWFKAKVLTLATSQIRDTLTYLNTGENITLENHRGHAINFNIENISNIQKLVIYKEGKNLPIESRLQKFHKSQTAGYIHLISGGDYLGIVKTLINPAELIEYLSYRIELIENWPYECALVNESALLGHYLRGDMSEPPQPKHTDLVFQLDDLSQSDWDISLIIKKFADQIIFEGNSTNYYPIITALAELKRNELAHFQERYNLSITNIKNSKFTLPYRIVSCRTNIGFIFIPIFKSEWVPHRLKGLQNFTLAHKYEQKLSKCIGITFTLDDHDSYTLDWMYAEFTWEYDQEMEDFISSGPPLRPVKSTEIQRYRFTRVC